MRRPIAAVALVLTAGMGRAQAPREQALVPDYVKASVVAPPESIQHDPFYKKYADALGIAILSSERVPDAALLVARDIVIHMLAKRPDLRREMVAKGMRVGVMAVTESTTDIPEHRDRKKPPPGDPRLTPGEKRGYETGTGIAAMSDKEYWDRRARGLGGNPTTCAEENLLGYAGTRYYGENIFVHEFSHAIMGVAIRTADADLFANIQAAYKAAMANGLYKGHHAETNANEYWAEGTQWWFWSNYEWFDGKTRLQTPDDLWAYDPTLYTLLDRVYADHHIPMDVYYAKNIPPTPARWVAQQPPPPRGGTDSYRRRSRALGPRRVDDSNAGRRLTPRPLDR
jgi:hypothetical protein